MIDQFERIAPTNRPGIVMHGGFLSRLKAFALPSMLQGFEKYSLLIESLNSPPILGDKAFYAPNELINEKFFLFSDGKLNAYYAPFHYMNLNARVVLIGLTPGWTQMERAFRTAKLAMAKGLTGDELFDCIKKSGSFSGPMRKNLVSMLDGIGLNQHLKLTSCGELFGSASALVHFTSAVSAPTFVNGKNFSGHGASFLKLPKREKSGQQDGQRHHETMRDRISTPTSSRG